METNQEIQNVINNVLSLRDMMERSSVKNSQYEKAIRMSYKINLITHILAMFLCLALIIFDLSAQPTILGLLNGGQSDGELQIYSIGFTIYILVLLMVVLYFLIWRAAKYSGTTIEVFIKENFSFMRNLNLVSDLLIKVSFICVLLFANKVNYVSAALVLFLADFLIQGKFFIFSINVSYMLSILCFSLSAYLVYSGQGQLVLALVVFMGLAAWSVLNLIKYNKGRG